MHQVLRPRAPTNEKQDERRKHVSSKLPLIYGRSGFTEGKQKPQSTVPQGQGSGGAPPRSVTWPEEPLARDPSRSRPISFRRGGTPSLRGGSISRGPSSREPCRRLSLAAHGPERSSREAWALRR